ncbi:MAG: glucose-6-phosphate isomerase [Pigmentiphaga sp.]|nr:glucose-6-phosphate isomerase [Pigmentiphaga sp.]
MPDIRSLPHALDWATDATWLGFVDAARGAQSHAESLRILDAAGLKVDVSAQRQSAALDQAAAVLLEQRGLRAAREALFAGEPVNSSERRAAWHTVLRDAAPPAEVAVERERVRAFVQNADTERRWRNIVHIGIGGSDWGPRLAVAAFGYTGRWRNIRFVSNIDGHAIEGGLAGLDPADTLIVVSSKSFTTTETLFNAERALAWLRSAELRDPWSHVVAITANPQRALDWGVPRSQVFRFWDWVGGRYSLWSSIGLPVALSVGSEVLAGMWAGATEMDRHFLQAPLERNAPVQLALSSVINRSVLGYGSRAVVPYDTRLFYLVPYLQQLEMESLGKSVDMRGEPVGLPTGPVVWGMPGTDAQHTFFQWLHQSSEGAPVDFIVCRQADHRWPEHHRLLLANCLAQRAALLRGKSAPEAAAEVDEPELAPHRATQGGRPSTLIVLPRLTPHALGALLALYEHKVFVESVIWGINPFDQWGVEYGKTMANGVAAELLGERSALAEGHDPSTSYWIDLLGRGQRSQRE